MMLSFDQHNQWIQENHVGFFTAQAIQNPVILNLTKHFVLIPMEQIIISCHLLVAEEYSTQGSSNLNSVRVFWNSRCAILHLISTTPANKIKKHWPYQNCFMLQETS